MATAASRIAAAIERIVEVALTDDELLNEIGLTAREAEMARIDPGYAPSRALRIFLNCLFERAGQRQNNQRQHPFVSS